MPALSPAQSPAARAITPATASAHGFLHRAGRRFRRPLCAASMSASARDDDRDRVDGEPHARRRLVRAPAERLATVHQVHSPDVVIVDDDL